MTFKLERKSVGATLTKFHVIDGTGTTVGSINVGNEQAGDLQKCWRGSAPAATATTAAGKHARAVNAIADALQKGRLTGPAAKQAILRGC